MTENTEELMIPSWTAEDYRNTTKPFDWLYENRQNKFILAQRIEQIKQQAGAVGVKNFITMWRAFLDMKSSQNGCVQPDNITEFSDQPLELYSGKYVCDDMGITYINSYGAEIIVCRHPILPIRRLVNTDTGEIKAEIAFKCGERWETRIYDRGVLASGQRIIELAKSGVAVDSQNAGELVEYLTFMQQENYKSLPETVCVGRLGWIKGCGFTPFSDELQFDGDAFFKHLFDTVQSKGDRNLWLNLVRKIRQNRSIANIQLAASFASVLVEPLHKLPFFLHLWGGTETGKSVGLMLAASVWGNPDFGEYLVSLNSTSVGLEMLSGFFNSLPLCLDELQIMKDRKDFDKEIYMLTEGVGRSRGAKTGGLQRIQTWRNCILTTGEQPITNANSGGGAVNRVIEIDCNGQTVINNAPEAASILKSNYGFVGREFVEQVESDIDLIRRVYDDKYRELLGADKTEKQAMAAALILTADQLIDEWIFHDGQRLTADEIEKCLKTKDEIDVNKRAFEYIKDVINSSPARFKVTDNNGELWGEIGDDAIYIIKSVFDRIMNEQGFNTSAFLSWAKRERILDCEDGRLTKKKRIRGTNITARCVGLFNAEWTEIKTDSDLDF